MNNGRDCEHGRQLGKCDTCDLDEAEKRITELEKDLNTPSKRGLLEVLELNNRHLERIAELEKERDAQIIKKEHAFKREKQLTAENLELKRKTFRNFDKEEYWIFQDDGEDYPESLVCPVVMSAEQFRRLLSLESNIQAHNLEQQAKGVEDFSERYCGTSIDIEHEAVRVCAKEQVSKLHKQAKELRGDV